MNVVCCVGRVEIQIEICLKIRVLHAIRTDSKVKSLTLRLSSVGPSSERMLETLDFTIRIGSTSTCSYFNS